MDVKTIEELMAMINKKIDSYKYDENHPLRYEWELREGAIHGLEDFKECMEIILACKEYEEKLKRT